MLKHPLIRVVLLGVPAMASLLANVAIVQAAEECRLSPGTAAPPGSKWLYRINRADHRHCWFLSSKAGGPHSQLARRQRHLPVKRKLRGRTNKATAINKQPLRR